MPRLIDADALKAEINDELGKIEACAYLALRNEVSRLRKGIDAVIDVAPTIDAEPVRHGKWEYLRDDEWFCSTCDETIDTAGHWRRPLYNYCPNCGAKMDLPEQPGG